MAIFLTEEDVQRLLPIDEAIETVEQGLREQGNGTGVNIPRHRVQAGGRGITMMLSVLGERGVAGFKAMGAGGSPGPAVRGRTCQAPGGHAGRQPGADTHRRSHRGGHEVHGP